MTVFYKYICSATACEMDKCAQNAKCRTEREDNMYVLLVEGHTPPKAHPFGGLALNERIVGIT